MIDVFPGRLSALVVFLLCLSFAGERAQACVALLPLPYDRESSFLVADYIAQGRIEKLRRFGRKGRSWTATVKIRRWIRGRLPYKEITVTFRSKWGRCFTGEDVKKGRDFFFLLRNKGRHWNRFIAGPADVYLSSGYNRWVFETNLRKSAKYNWRTDRKTGLSILLVPSKKKASRVDGLSLTLYFKSRSRTRLRLPFDYQNPRTSVWVEVHVGRNGRRLNPGIQRKKMNLYRQKKQRRSAVIIEPGGTHFEVFDFMGRCIMFPKGQSISGFRCFRLGETGEYVIYVRLRNFPRPGFSMGSGAVKIELVR